MADNVPVTPGVGASIATDDVGGVQYQIVKLDVGADGASSPVTADSPFPMAVKAPVKSYAPGYEPNPGGTASPTVDEMGYTQVRGTVMTDEGGSRTNFANSGLALSIGNCTFTNGSDAVTTAGHFSDYPVHLGDYIYLDADGASYALRVDWIDDQTIWLASAYAGTGGTGASSVQAVISKVGSGGSFAVSNGKATLGSGTTNGSVQEIERDVDIMPLTANAGFSISQRIANQNIYYGFYDENSGGAARWYFWFDFNGTVNTSVNCVCGWNPTTAPSGGEISTTTVKLPDGITTATSNRWRIEALKDRVIFWCNDIALHTEYKVVPHPSDFLTLTLRIVNGTSPAGNTNVVCDYFGVANYNVVTSEYATSSVQAQAPCVPSVDYSYSVAGVITINTDLLFIDCRQFRSLQIQCVSMGTTGVVTPSFSNDDGTTFVGGMLIPSAGGAIATTFNAAGLWTVPVTGRICRLRLTTATTAGTTTLRVAGLHQPANVAPSTISITGTVSTSTAGVAAHDSAVSGNPVRIAGRALTAAYTTVATGDTADFISTLQGVQITKPYQIPELEWNISDEITNSTTAVQVKALAASLKQYVSSLSIASETLGAAGYVQLRTTPVASASATISANTLVMPATYNWKVGDLIYVTASTVSGLSAGSYYYLLTVSTTSLTFSATRGGGTLAISGTSVTATISKVLWRTYLNTTALPLTQVQFMNPCDTGTALALEMCTPTALTSGKFSFSVVGYTAP